MDDAQRFQLLGAYRTPRFRYGKIVLCEVRGQVAICGLTDGPIPWPIGKQGRHKAVVVFGGLARAVQRESAIAVAHWWGVTDQTVWKRRKALGVGPSTPGTHKLRSGHTQEPWAIEARAKAHAKARDPARRAKIAAAMTGKERPAHVIQAVIDAHLGTRHSEETRQKMSQTHKKRGTLVPGTIVWTKAKDRLVGTLSVAEAARQTGRTEAAVKHRKARLQVPQGR